MEPVPSNGVMALDLVRRLARLDSTVLSDALDECGLTPGTGELRAQWPGARLSGVARTVALEPHRGDAPGPHIASAVIASADRGDVVVIANGGRMDVSGWGGLLSLGCVERGLGGAVVDGACRDVAEARAYGLPVFARGTSPRTARGRLRQRSVAEPVRIAGIVVNDRDLVAADDSGVVFIPRGDAERVIELAEQVAVRERAIADDIREGATLSEAMHDARLAGRRGGSAGESAGAEAR